MGDERAGQTHIRSNRRLRPASDAKILDIFEGTKQIHQLISAHWLLGMTSVVLT
jgi:alkylation response protein AidB-like acyl-CoA dehydrogenase